MTALEQFLTAIALVVFVTALGLVSIGVEPGPPRGLEVGDQP